jgi:signal peptidase I, archaeal type
MVKSLAQINEEFRIQKKLRKDILKFTLLDAEFAVSENQQAPVETIAVADVTADTPMEEIVPDEQKPEPADALDNGLDAVEEPLTKIEAESLPEGVVLQELELSLLYGPALAAEMEFEGGLEPEPEPPVGRGGYRPRGLDDIEHEFREKMGRGRREHAPKTVHHRQIASGISTFIYYALTIVLVLTAWIYAQNGRLFLGDYQMHNVLTSSMESVYPQGTLIVTKPVNPKELVVGNDITFYRDATTTVIHRITTVHENFNNSGQLAFTTKGVNNQREDSDILLSDNVIGKVVFFIPHIGNISKNISSQFPMIIAFLIFGYLFSFFLNITIGETSKERKIRKAEAVLKGNAKEMV